MLNLLKPLVILLLVGFVCMNVGPLWGGERYRASEAHMGTRFTITLQAESQAAARQGFQAAFARIEQLDAALSDYQPESELNRLCRQSPTPQPVEVSSDLYQVLTASQSVSRQTRGAFDVTVGPLTRLWREARKQKQLPSEEVLAEAHERVGYQHVELSQQEGKYYVKLLKPGMQLDLGGIAKGFALDEAIATLHELGIDRVLIDGGGDLACMSPSPETEPWRLGIAPLQPQAPPSASLRITRGGLATSGDAWQFIEIAGKRYSHLVDPRTGLGLQQRSSVTVLAPNGMLADAWASAVSVLGPERGIELIDSLAGLEAMVVVAGEGEAMTFQSKGMRERLHRHE